MTELDTAPAPAWAAAREQLRNAVIGQRTAIRPDRAQSATPPVLCASRNGTTHGLTEARPYALKATVERVR